MVLSRFWYGVLALAVALTGAAVLLTQSTWNRHSEAHVSDQLQRDRLEVEMWLKLDARARIESLASLAADAQLRRYLRSSSEGQRGTLAAERSAVEDRLQGGEGETARGQPADIGFVIDANQVVVAQAGAAPMPDGTKLPDQPVFRRALKGYVGSGMWVHQSLLYLVAAHPVTDQAQYIGAVIQAKRIDDSFVETLSERLGGATLAFFQDGKVFAQHQSAVGTSSLDGVLPALAAVLNDNRAANQPAEAVTDGGTAKILVSMLQINEMPSKVGYLTVRSRQLLNSVFGIFSIASAEDAAAVRTWLVWLLLGAVALWAVGLLAIFLEYDRPMRRLSKSLDDLLDDAKAALQSATLSRPFRKLAAKMQEVIERRGKPALAAELPADMDDILGGEPGSAASQDYFAFQPPVPPRLSKTEPQKAQPVVKATKPMAPPLQKARPPNGSASLSNMVAETTDVELSATDLHEEIEAISMAPPAEAAPVVQPGPKVTAAHAASAAASAGSSSREPRQRFDTQPSAPADMPEVASSSSGQRLSALTAAIFDEDDGATMVSEPMDALLHTLPPSPLDPPREGEHFQQVFKQFIETRQQCNESIAELNFERFSQMLRRNIDQIRQSHGTTDVRFKVYVKDGRAALKATPRS